jgi:predicted transcriptional regulator
MTPRVTPRQVSIDDEHYRALEEIGQQEDRSVSYLVRQATKIFIERKAEERQADDDKDHASYRS